jgi:hypothetical protein
MKFMLVRPAGNRGYQSWLRDVGDSGVSVPDGGIRFIPHHEVGVSVVKRLQFVLMHVCEGVGWGRRGGGNFEKGRGWAGRKGGQRGESRDCEWCGTHTFNSWMSVLISCMRVLIRPNSLIWEAGMGSTTMSK